MNTHDTLEDLHEAEYGDDLLMYADGEWWLAFASEDGDWLAIRVRHEDDGIGPAGDPWRPIGPMSLEDDCFFPVQVIPLCEVATLSEQLDIAQAEVKRLQDRNSDLSWEVNPDRMGQ